MEVKIFRPHPALQEFVLTISTVKATLPEGIKEVVTPYPPTPFQSLMFYCNHSVSMSRQEERNFEQQPLSVLIGPQFSRVNVKVYSRLNAIRVNFLPGGMYRMLGVPMNELFDGGFDALDFFGAEIRRINEQLQHASNLQEGKNIIEKFLLSRVTNRRVLLPIDSAIRILLNNNGNLSIEKTASLACLSLKQFERKCT